jgi:hypothetical protein
VPNKIGDIMIDYRTCKALGRTPTLGEDSHSSTAFYLGIGRMLYKMLAPSKGYYPLIQTFVGLCLGLD